MTVEPGAIAETGGAATVTVQTGGATFEDDQTVTLEIAGGTATAGDDFTVADAGGNVLRAPSPYTLTLGAGERSVTGTITAVDDSLDEADETVVVAARHDTGRSAAQILTVVDDDRPAWRVTAVPGTIAEAGGAATVTVTTGGTTFAGEQSIALDFSDGTATAGVDFTVADAEGQALSAPHALTLAAGATTVAATLTAVDDSDTDAGERIGIAARLDGALLGAAQSVAIVDDDTPGVTVAPVALAVPEGGSASWAVVLNTEPTADVTVTVARASGGDENLSATPQTLTFTAADYAGAQTVTVTAAVDDDQSDAEATFTHAAESGDTDYHGIAIDSVAATHDDRTLVLTGFADAEAPENAPWTSGTPTLTGAAGAVFWTLAGADAGAFTIDAVTGALILAAQNFETPADADAMNTYEVIVTATDSAEPPPAASTAVALTVTVDNENEPPTGRPVIGATARVGEPLTVDTADIDDPDGLTGVSFTYQWLRDDGTTEPAIAGATKDFYVPVGADVGKPLTVVVSFTDGGGTSWSRSPARRRRRSSRCRRTSRGRRWRSAPGPTRPPRAGRRPR